MNVLYGSAHAFVENDFLRTKARRTVVAIGTVVATEELEMAKVDWARPRFLFVALLSSALWLNGCAEEIPTPGPEKTGTKSPAKGDDDASEEDDDEGVPEGEEADDVEDSKPPTKLDAGTPKPKPDAAVIDAKAPTDTTKKPDAGSDEPVEVPGDASTGSDTTDGGKSSPEHEDLGPGDGKDVIAIGDSWMSLVGTGIQQSLVKVSKQPYRTYGVAGTMLLNEQIPGQYASAKRADPDIKTVVMTGGGNDIILAGGDPKTTIPKIAKRLDELWTEMGKDGVQDVVYIEYSEGGTNGPNVRMGIEQVGPVCMNHKALRCHFMLSDPIINKQLRDGIHPTDAGYDKIGKAVYDLMVSEGMRR